MTRPRWWFLAIAILLAMLTRGWPDGEESLPNCDPSYPVCIPMYPPDLDCDEIPYRDFQVSGPDPHGFDADHDGVGCKFWPPRDVEAVPPQ